MDQRAWQVVVVVRGRIVRDACTPSFREHVVRGAALEATREPIVVDGWRVHLRARAGVAALVGTPTDTDPATAQAYADALVDAHAPPEPPFVVAPPSSSSGGASGAPALIASYTPARAPN